MASLYEFGGSDEEAPGALKACKSTKTPQLLVVDSLPVPNKILLLYISEGAIAMSLEGEVFLNTRDRKLGGNSGYRVLLIE
jgi:hypothetical protein